MPTGSGDRQLATGACRRREGNYDFSSSAGKEWRLERKIEFRGSVLDYDKAEVAVRLHT
jgi:hypothetical protein